MLQQLSKPRLRLLFVSVRMPVAGLVLYFSFLSLSVSRNTFSLSLILTLSHTTCCAEASCVERCALLKLKYSFLDIANADLFSPKMMHSIG